MTQSLVVNPQVFDREVVFDKNKFEKLVYNRKVKNSNVILLKHKRREMIINMLFVFATISIIIYFAMFSFLTLSKRLSLISKQRKLSQIQSMLISKQNENEMLEADISQMIDKEYVRNFALVRLSMHEPKEKDYIYYNKSKTFFVRQYDSVR